MCQFDAAEECLVHIFDVEDDVLTPREQRCDCGEVTWGEMDDLLTLTTMWALEPAGG